MKTLKMLTSFLCAVALVGTPLEAQEATVVIEGYAYGRIAGFSHECPLRETGSNWRIDDGYVGMQVSCPIWAVDADDNFTPAAITVSINDSSRVSAVVVHVPKDTLGQYVADTLKIQVLRQGNWGMRLEANPLLDIFGYMYERPAPDDPVRNEGVGSIWPQIEDDEGNIRVVVGETFLLCAYELGAWVEDFGYQPVAKSYERPRACPDPEGYPNLPEIQIEWTLPDVLERVQDASPSDLSYFVKSAQIRPRWVENTRHRVPMTASGTRQR